MQWWKVEKKFPLCTVEKHKAQPNACVYCILLECNVEKLKKNSHCSLQKSMRRSRMLFCSAQWELFWNFSILHESRMQYLYNTSKLVFLCNIYESIQTLNVNSIQYTQKRAICIFYTHVFWNLHSILKYLIVDPKIISSNIDELRGIIILIQ